MYKIIEKLNKNLIVASHPVFGNQLWSLIKPRSHKADNCAICSLPIGEKAYRPITNRQNRGVRICTRTH